MVEALADLHARGCVHGDIKPDNFVLTEDGRVQLIDFESASLVGKPPCDWGTPGFNAPEKKVRGWDGCASDVWSLGKSICQLCEEEVPADDASGGHAEVTIVDSTPEVVKNLVNKMLVFNPTDRITASDASDELTRVDA
jgi:serine/threonine protein kinase